MPPKKRVVQVARDLPEPSLEHPFSILFVCTGNVCRSPAAEALFARKLVDGEELPISSAGTEALVGADVDPRMRELLPPDAKIDDFSARQLTAEMVSHADLVLGMTREHRGAAVALHPPALRYSFTLKEFAGIIDSQNGDQFVQSTLSGTSSAQWLAELVPLASARRVRFTSRRAGSLDIEDPWGRSSAVFRASFHEIAVAVDSISRHVHAQE